MAFSHSGGSGNGPELATLVIDYAEVTIDYVWPSAP